MPIQNRKLHMDALRVLAILMIMFNHTGGVGFSLYTVCTEGILYWIYLFIAIFVKSAVPIFFMISGALLLPKNESFRDIFFKRILKIFCALLLGIFVHYLYFSNWQLSVFSVRDYLKFIYTGEIVIQYWYLYAYLGYLLMLPILRALAQNLSTKWLIYTVILYFGMKSLPILEFLLFDGDIKHSIYFSIFIMGDNIFYPLLGYLLEHRLLEKNYKKSAFGWAAVLIVIVVVFSSVLTYRNSVLTNIWDEGNTQEFFQNLIFIPAACIYYMVKQVFSRYKVHDGVANSIVLLGSCTFGVYLFETIYRVETRYLFEMLVQYLPTLVACAIWIVDAFLVGVVVTWILKKIPIINKIL